MELGINPGSAGIYGIVTTYPYVVPFHSIPQMHMKGRESPGNIGMHGTKHTQTHTCIHTAYMLIESLYKHR